MTFQSEFIDIALGELHREAAIKKAEGWRFIQTHAVNTDDGVDLYYSFMKDGAVSNLAVRGVRKDDVVPSITDLFLAAFVFENEARELFGVDMRDIAIDFAGAMYAPAESEPMTFISPEQKAAREKAAKVQAAKAAKQKAKAEGASGETGDPKGATGGFVMTPERKARLDAKLATMSPDKVAKVQAALKALESRPAQAAPSQEQAQKAAVLEAPAPARESGDAGAPAGKQASAPAVDAQLEQTIGLMDAEKATKVRAALDRRAGIQGAPAAEPAAPSAADSDLEAKIALLDEDKAERVRAALAAKAARAQAKGGE